jgi:hypothetical protein
MSKYKSEISQEEFEEIEQYLLGKLSEREQNTFENRMEKDGMLKDEVALQRRLLTAVELGSLEGILKISTVSETKLKPIGTKRFLLYAAAIIVLFVFGFLGWILTRDFGTGIKKDLYSAYFYPDPGLPVVMSSSNDYIFYDGMVSYKEGKYEEAMELWGKLPTERLSSDTLLYYLGMATLNLDQYQESSKFLGEVVADSQSVFQQKAIWYKALISLRQNENDQAKALLEKLLPDPQADALLLELSESP